MWPMLMEVRLFITAKWAITIEIARLTYRLHQTIQSLSNMSLL